VNDDLFKGLAHIDYQERYHSRPEQLVLSCMLQCCLPRCEAFSSSGRPASLGSSQLGFPL
jgi:hypothetical protein